MILFIIKAICIYIRNIIFKYFKYNLTSNKSYFNLTLLKTFILFYKFNINYK